MKIIITNTFKKDYYKFIWKNVNCWLFRISSVIHKVILTQKIFLKRPYLKLKFNFCNKAVRLLIINKKDVIIPIFITDKNDKKYWYNMIWKNISSLAKKLSEKFYLDIEKNNFDIF
jgi:hypothetical protein